MNEMNIPDFITLVAAEIREAVQRFKSTGNTPILYLNGLDLQIAFTAEELPNTDGKVELKPWIFTTGDEGNKGQQIVHAVNLHLAASVIAEPPPPFDLRHLKKADFGLFLEVVRQLRTTFQAQVFTGPDVELIPPFPITWRNSTFTIEIRRRLAKELLLNIDKLNAMKDVANLYQGCMEDLVFVPIAPFAPPPSSVPVAAAPLGVGFR